MRVGVKLDGARELGRMLGTLSGPQAAQAYALAMTDGGFHVRRFMVKGMETAFDRPTSYILRSVFVRKAQPGDLSVTIEPTYFGGKGVDPQKILQAQEFGGARRDKRSEVALRRAGILPAGFQTTIPETPYPGSDDGRGNLRGAFLVQLLTYFQAMGEQGYRANMTERRKANVHKGTKKQAGRRYFVAYGRLRSGKTSHLAPGIWAASGTGGHDVRPVLLFVRPASYRSRLSMEAIADASNVGAYIERRVRYRLRQAVGL